MRFRSRQDGKHYPVRQGVSESAFNSVRAQNRSKNLTRKQKAKLASLENPLLWKNFVKKLKSLNPDFDLEDNVNRSLEPEEALNDLRKKFPYLNLGDKAVNEVTNFREFLADEFGIENTRVQNMVAMEEPPLNVNELGALSYALTGRPPNAIAVDKSLRAPIAKNLRDYTKDPARLDIQTVDR